MIYSGRALPCPGCGKPVPVPSSNGPVICAHCGEELGVSSDKFFLLQPERRYSDLADSSPEVDPAPVMRIDAAKPPGESELLRKQLSIERALDRIEVEKSAAARNSKTGVGLVFFGIVFGLVILVRAVIGTGGWIDWIAPALVAIGLFSAGIYLFASGVLVSRASRREEEELERELELIQGNVANDS